MEKKRRERRMKSRRKLTAKFVEKIKAVRSERGEPERTEYAETGCPGLYLTVNASGRRSWNVRYRRKSDGRSRCLALSWEASLATAPKLTVAVLDRVANGHDPAAEKQAERQAPTRADNVESVMRMFLIEHRSARGGKPIRLSTKDRDGPPAWLRGCHITRRDIHDLLSGPRRVQLWPTDFTPTRKRCSTSLSATTLSYCRRTAATAFAARRPKRPASVFDRPGRGALWLVGERDGYGSLIAPPFARQPTERGFGVCLWSIWADRKRWLRPAS